MSGEWLDRLALRVVRQQPPPVGASGDSLLARRELLRRGAAGALVLAGFGGHGVRGAAAAAASGAAAASCNKGSLAACYSESHKNYTATLSFCTRMHDRFDSLGCIVDTVNARAAGRKECRAKCPKPKKKGPKGPKGGGGGGGGTAPPPAKGRPPTCGQVDCATGDKCCPAEGGPICCVVCCAKNGNGCGSSDSDC